MQTFCQMPLLKRAGLPQPKVTTVIGVHHHLCTQDLTAWVTSPRQNLAGQKRHTGDELLFGDSFWLTWS